jgi:hypothetical protein
MAMNNAKEGKSLEDWDAHEISITEKQAHYISERGT